MWTKDVQCHRNVVANTVVCRSGSSDTSPKSCVKQEILIHDEIVCSYFCATKFGRGGRTLSARRLAKRWRVLGSKQGGGEISIHSPYPTILPVGPKHPSAGSVPELFTGAKRPGRCVDNPSQSSAENTNEWIYTSTHTACRYDLLRT
jgi:hypothetical protein